MATALPCCLPLLASVAGVIGLSSFTQYSKYIVYAVQGFALVAAYGSFLSFRKHEAVWPFILTCLSVGAIFYVYNISLIPWLLYSALAGLVMASIWNIIEVKRCNKCSTVM